MTNEEFEFLLNLPKRFKKNGRFSIPGRNSMRVFELESDTTDEFVIDYDRRGSIELKYKTQLRENKTHPIVRVEINAPPHMNPDGITTGRNHIHIYREGYELKWAYDLDNFNLPPEDLPLALFTFFCDYCHVEKYEAQGVI